MRDKPVESSVQADGQRLTVWRWAGEPPAVVLCHATGFHGRCWDQIVERLRNRLCIAVDFRGHGRSGKPAPPYPWRAFGKDLAAVLAELEIRGAVGVGHSMGGHAAVVAAALQPSAFSRLLLLDPVIRPPGAYTGPSPELGLVLRRRNQWDSPEQMFERFQHRPPFQSWDPATLRDYCNFALQPSPDGQGFVLACAPAVESAIYSNNSAVESNIYPEVSRIGIPVQVVRSGGKFDGTNFQASPTAPDLSASFAHGRDTALSKVSHFIPMEAPDLTAEMIVAGKESS